MVVQKESLAALQAAQKNHQEREKLDKDELACVKKLLEATRVAQKSEEEECSMLRARIAELLESTKALTKENAMAEEKTRAMARKQEELAAEAVASENRLTKE